MDKSLFGFIWKHSKKDQIILLCVTLATFPTLYVTLELPKRIINDAIGGSGGQVDILGYSLDQIQFLMLLCFGFLVAVLANGLLKMRLNTIKGVLAERLLRRFRYQLLNRLLKFPRPYFRTTSQGELVSMVTSEAEPMGGLMGDMLSQPVFQAGQMLTILAFLFAQSIWFGLASIALIPLQAWLIPKLQRQINQLNKARVQEVRKLAADIGESASGVSDLRTNGGLRHRNAMFSDRLGNLFGIRLNIYQKKFFMKFLNNFINQLTPFFFYSVGGYLAINGQITVGALVAALAAYKDLSSPWKELLAYYNQTQDMALRWEVVTDKFAPDTLVDETLLEGAPTETPRLIGDIEIDDVTVVDEDGQVVLEDLTLTIPYRSRVAIKVENETAARAFASLLTREVVARRGRVSIAGHNLSELHQSVLAHRIGYAHSRPHLFQGTLGDNVLMAFQSAPMLEAAPSGEIARKQSEAERAGNSIDPFNVDWMAPGIAEFQSAEEVRAWWFRIVEAMGNDEVMVRRALRSRLVPGKQQELQDAIVALRPEVAARLKTAGLDDIVHRYDPEKFNPVSPLASNLLFALPDTVLSQEALARETSFVEILREHGIADELAQMSAQVVQDLITTFGADGIDHPLFRRLNMSDELYARLTTIVSKRRIVGDEGLSREDYALILTVPFAFSAEQMGQAFGDDFKERILKIRRESADEMVAKMGGLLKTLDPERYFPVKSVMGNAIFGRISATAGARETDVEDVIVSILTERGQRQLVAQSIFDLETTQGGDNVPDVLRERVALSRASIKKPDVLILENVLVSDNAQKRTKARNGLSELMPNTTIISIEKQIDHPDEFDLFFEIKDGRVDGVESPRTTQDDGAQQDLARKLRAVSETELFGQLAKSQQRLLAFSGQWFPAKADQLIFEAGQEPDAVFICVEGSAGLYWPEFDGESTMVSKVEPGRLIGDLAIIQGERRTLDLRATENSKFLRIGASDFMAVVESDSDVAVTLMKSIAGHMLNTTRRLRETRDRAAQHGVQFAGLLDDAPKDLR